MFFPHRANSVKPETPQTSISAPSLPLWPSELPADTSAPRVTREPEGIFLCPERPCKRLNSALHSILRSYELRLDHRSYRSSFLCEQPVWKTLRSELEKKEKEEEK